MTNNISFFICIFLLTSIMPLQADGGNVVYDNPNENMLVLFSRANTKYVLRYRHQFNGVLKVPDGVTIEFKGGSLKGRIDFNNTKLQGEVRLQGSTISGHLRNHVF